MMKGCVPSTTCLQQLIRREQKNSLEQSVTWESLSQIWQPALNERTKYQWSHEQQKEEIKSILIKDGGPVLRFFDVQKPFAISSVMPPEPAQEGCCYKKNVPLPLLQGPSLMQNQDMLKLRRNSQLFSSAQNVATNTFNLWKESYH